MAKTPEQNPDERESVTIDILEELGIVSNEQAHDLRKQKGTSRKRFMDLLLQDVSLNSIKEVLSYPVNFPWKDRGRIREALSQEGLVSMDAVEQFLAPLENFDRQLKVYLIRKEFLKQEQIDNALEAAKESGVPFWRALVNLKYITPRVLSDFAKELRMQQTADESVTRLLQALLEAKAISRETLNRLTTQSVQLGDIVEYLIREGISFQGLADVLRREFKIDVVSPREIMEENAALYSIPDSFVQRNKAIPVRKTTKTLDLGMVNPLDEGTLEQVRLITGLEGKAFLISPDDFQTLYKRFYTDRAKDMTFLENTPEAMLHDASAVQLVASIIEGAIKARATDIHFESMEDGLRVRFRIDGLLYDVTTIPQHQIGAVIARIKILAEMDITDKRHPQDGHFAINMPQARYDLRISSIPTYHGEKVVVRILDETKVIRGILQLGLPTKEQRVVENLVHRPHGMILATGPMGSGKTTTLYAMLNELDILHQNIVTIENPVEYHLPGITQVQVNADNGVSFSEGLRALLRQDANVIMVGEIRDSDTAHVATWAALTGHLVLSTLHTNDTAGAVTMLSNLGIARYLVAGAINGIISSRLVRRLCATCKEAFEADSSFLRSHKLEELGKPTFYRAVGCKECNYIGYRGMTGVYEIMPISEELRQAILSNADEPTIESLSRKQGMRTLYEAGVLKVAAGETTLDEIHRKIMRT